MWIQALKLADCQVGNPELVRAWGGIQGAQGNKFQFNGGGCDG
jgi:hypothetical protein